MMSSRISIIIVNYNGWSDTVECLNSILDNDFVNCEILILDNNSPNDSADQLTHYLKNNQSVKNLKILDYDETFNSDFSNVSERKDFPLITLIRSKKNKGFAGGNNICLEWFMKQSNIKEVSPNDKIFLLNPDTIIPRNCLQKISEIDYPKFLASVPIFNYFERTQLINNGGYRINKYFGIIKHKISDGKIDYVYGGALITNVNTFQLLGFLPEEYFLYWEETDYCTQAKLKNIPLKIIYTTHIWDKVGQSIGRGRMANYYFIRNSFIYYKKYKPYFLPTLLIFNLIRLAYKGLKGDSQSFLGMRQGITDFFKNKKGEKNFS